MMMIVPSISRKNSLEVGSLSRCLRTVASWRTFICRGTNHFTWVVTGHHHYVAVVEDVEGAAPGGYPFYPIVFSALSNWGGQFLLLKSGPNSKSFIVIIIIGAPCQSLGCLFPRGIFPQQGPAGDTMMKLTMMLKRLPLKGSYKGDLSDHHKWRKSSPSRSPRGKEMSLSRCIGLYYKLPKSDPNSFYLFPNAVYLLQCCFIAANIV